MTKNKKIGVLGVGVLSALALVGCNDSTMTEEEMVDFQEKIDEMVENQATTEELVEYIGENIGKIEDLDVSTFALDSLLYTMQVDINGFYDDLDRYRDEISESFADIDEGRISSEAISQIENETLKNVLQGIHEDYFILENLGGDLLIVPNVEFIMSEYGDYMNEAFKSMVEFTIEEENNRFFDVKTDTLDLDLIVNRIMELENLIDEHSDSIYANSMKSSRYFYLQSYLGVNNDFVKDVNEDGDDIFSPDLINHFRSTLKENEGSESQFIKELQELLDVLEEENGIISSKVEAKILDITDPNPEMDIEDIEDLGEFSEEELEALEEDILNSVENENEDEDGETEEAENTEDSTE